MNLPKGEHDHDARAMNAGGASQRERGFTLIETAIALLIMMIVMLAAASLFSFSIYNNSGGTDRAQALAIAQESMERLRSLPYTRTNVHHLLNPGTFTQRDVYRGGQNSQRPYDIVWTVHNTTQTLKTITVSVIPTGAGKEWATGTPAAVTLVTQRAEAE